jgi:XTP/dITP diphosphohydrolase
VNTTVPLRVVLATHNAHKVEELRQILGARLQGIELIAYDGPEAVEDGQTFEENALIKARAASRHTGLPTIADDSGISVDALGGAPGIRSARYSGGGGDGANLALLVTRMRGVADRRAHFTCAAAFIDGGFQHVEIGSWPGTLLEEPVGTGGFGYDPIFLPDGSAVSAAELTAEQKNSMSHRALAFGRLIEVIRSR